MRLVGPITLYTHKDSTYEHYEHIRDKAGWEDGDEAARHLKDFLDERPLYEVAFEFRLDLDAGTAYCTKVDLGDGEPFERPCPGQQLSLF